ncbi:MAG: nucleotide exchange factor GrpE [Nitrospirota bacterium]
MDQDEKNPNTIDELEAKTQEVPSPSEESQEETRPVAELRQALSSKTAECQALQDKYLRLAAEFENYKRVAQREQREQIRFGNEQILRELLPVIDNLERAIRSAKENGGGEALVQGVELTLKQLTEALAKFGVRPIASVGEPFDPTCHQAVAQVESAAVAANTVVEEFQKGYLLHDRLLRAAMVSVSTGTPDKPENSAS